MELFLEYPADVMLRILLPRRVQGGTMIFVYIMYIGMLSRSGARGKKLFKQEKLIFCCHIIKS